MVILIVLLELLKFAGDSAGCHCLGRVLRSAKQHDLYEAVAYTHVSMGFWGKLAFRSVWALAADSQGQIALIIQNVVGCSLRCRASHSNATRALLQALPCNTG